MDDHCEYEQTQRNLFDRKLENKKCAFVFVE